MEDTCEKTSTISKALEIMMTNVGATLRVYSVLRSVSDDAEFVISGMVLIVILAIEIATYIISIII